VYNAIHWHYDEKEKREIWQCLWLAKQVLDYTYRCLQWWAATIVTILAVAMMWNFYRNFTWIAVILPAFLYKARQANIAGEWYRIRLATLMHDKKEFYAEIDERIAEARQNVEENEPTITIEVEFESEESP
jgi:hypothetical protein